MRVEVIMPQMGESIVEGTVVSWLKKPGDAVQRDEDIFTISTDKVDADIPSPAAGVLKEILVDVGATVEVGSVVAYIETEAEAEAEAEAGKPAQKQSEPEETPAPPPPQPDPRAGDGKTASMGPVNGGGSGATEEAESASGNGAAGGVQPTEEELRRTRSTPLVRRIAREHGISDLSSVPGTGVSGRVTKRDILDYIARGEEAAEEQAPVAREATERVPISSSPATRPSAARPPTDAIVVDRPRIHLYDEDRVEPMSRMRRSIAEHMVASRHISAHAQSVWECDWTRALEARKALKESFAARGVKLTITAFLVDASVRALAAHPNINASLDGDKIVYRGRINVGVAVAIPDGLIVPVIKRADELNLLGIARAVNDVGQRARDKKLLPADVEGGTFTVSNPGAFGSLFGIPIISQPQTAILGVGAVKKRLVVDDDDSIRIAPQNIMCLSWDHRVIDGAQADAFMKTLVDAIENYEVG